MASQVDRPVAGSQLDTRAAGAEVVWRWAAAGVCGGSVALAFPPYDLAMLLPVGVAGLTLTCAGTKARTAAGAGGAFGLVFCLSLMPWLRVIGVDAWIAVGLLEALFYAALGVGVALVTRLAGWPIWVAGLWVATELARSSVPFGGLPWGRLAFATADTPMAPYSRYAGVAAVTALVVLASNLALWGLLALRSRRLERPLDAASAGAGVAALLGALGLVLVGFVLPQAAPPSGHAVVALVQGNVPSSGLDAFAQARAVLDNHAAASHALADRVRAGDAPAPDLVIWPESSTDVDPFADPSAAATISAAVGDLGVPTLVGAMVDDQQTAARRNLGVVWDPVTGPGQRYLKRHAVPFGEYIPMRSLLAPLFDRLDQIPQDLAPGEEPGVLRLGPVLVGDVICFEVAYDGLVRDVVTTGAQLLVVQTNNATYLGTGQLEQQWAISRLRAIETGRSVGVAATNGISGFATPDGRVLARSAPGTRALLVQRVSLYDALTPAMRLGGAVELLLAFTGVGAVALAVARTRARVTVRAGGGGG
jgi:apolipoprotein N-acyltransferase